MDQSPKFTFSCLHLRHDDKHPCLLLFFSYRIEKCIILTAWNFVSLMCDWCDLWVSCCFRDHEWPSNGCVISTVFFVERNYNYNFKLVRVDGLRLYLWTRPPTGLMFIPQMIHECGEPHSCIDKGKTKNSEKNCPSITNPTWSDAGANTGRRGESLATDRLSHSTGAMLHIYQLSFTLCTGLGLAG
jgi:hypothetical protein